MLSTVFKEKKCSWRSLQFYFITGVVLTRTTRDATILLLMATAAPDSFAHVSSLF